MRLWYPELPEKRTDDPSHLALFPTPLQVAEATHEQLRSAGLSGRKARARFGRARLTTQAEYVQGLGEMFADGRLTAEKLVAMSDEEVTETLVAVRGIGIWTVQMGMIFTCAVMSLRGSDEDSFRRPDVMPWGDRASR